MITVDDPGTTCSRVCPEGKGGRLSFSRDPRGPRVFRTVDSSGLVVSMRMVKPSTPIAPVMSARVVMIDVAIPFRVATFTRLTNFPVLLPSVKEMVWYAGPVSLMGAGMASVIPKI